jgi:hypothetical protein
MPLLRSCLANAAFRSGSYDTSFLPQHYGGPRESPCLLGMGSRGLSRCAARCPLTHWNHTHTHSRTLLGGHQRTHADGLEPTALPLTPKQQQDMFAAAVFTHVDRARRYHPGLLTLGKRVELTLTWRDVHADKLIPLPVVVRLASQQMVGPEGVCYVCVLCRLGGCGGRAAQVLRAHGMCVRSGLICLCIAAPPTQALLLARWRCSCLSGSPTSPPPHSRPALTSRLSAQA